MNDLPATRPVGAGKKLVFALVLIGLVLGSAALLVEASLRVAGWRAPGLYDAQGDPVPVGVTTGEGGPFPPVDGVLHTFEYEVPYHVNRDGFRERDPVPKAPDEWRVGLFGDSHIAGYGVERQDRFGDLWIADRRRRQPDAELWNFGAPNTGTHHMADVLEGVAAGYDLDEIVLAMSAINELGDNIDWQRAHTGDEAPSVPRKRSLLAAFLKRHSRLAMLLWFQVAHGLLADRTPPVHETLDYLDEGWPITERALGRFLAAVGNRPFEIWYLPATLDWNDEAWKQVQDDLGPGSTARRHEFRDRVRDWATAHGVTFVDATPWLQGHPLSEVKFAIDVHYNANGHRLLAEGFVAHDRARTADAGRPASAHAATDHSM